VTRMFKRLAAAIAAAVGLPVALAGGIAHADYSTLPPLVCERSISISDDRGYEGDIPTSGGFYFQTLFAFTVTSSGCNRAGTVAYQTQHFTTEPFDYTSTSGTLTFASGDATSKTVYVWVTRDGSPGPNEFFWVKLSAPSADITVNDGWGLGTILNDDDACVAPPDLPPGAEWQCME